MRQFLHNINMLCGTHFNLENWKEIDTIMDRVTCLYKLWIVKHMSRFSGTNYMIFNHK